MPIIQNQFQIDAQQAIDTINRLQTANQRYNASLGQVISQITRVNAANNDVITTITSVDAAGRKYTQTIRDLGTSHEVLGVKIGQATAAQRREAAEMEKRLTLARQLGAALAGGQLQPTGTVLPGVDPNKTSKSNLEALSKITQEQMKTIVDADRRLYTSGRNTRLMMNVPRDAKTALDAINSVSRGVDTLKGKLHEAGQIAFATAIYRSLSVLQMAIADGTRSAVDFSKQIGLIQTLAGQGNNDYQQWAASIRAVADEFGRPVGDVAAAAYEGLSSQIIKTTKDMDVLRASTELARNTASSDQDALSVLASVLNTFGDRAGNADQITNKLFTTVDLGNVKLGELSSVIGQTSSLAQTASVKFNEIAAALIVLTNQGLNSAEAGTILSNVINQLLKPSESLKKLFQDLGYNSGEAAVSAEGFIGVIKRIREEADRTGKDISEFVLDLRALRGVGTFDARRIEQYTQALKELENVNRNRQATQGLNNNTGFQLEGEVERLKTVFTVDIGQTIIETLAKVTQSLGGVKQLLDDYAGTLKTIGTLALAAFAVPAAITFLGTVGGIVTACWRLVQALPLIGVAATGAFALFTNPAVVAAVVAFTAAAAGTALVLDKLNRDAREAYSSVTDAATKAKEAQIQALRDTETARVSELEKGLTASTQKYQQFVAKQRQQNNQLITNLTESGKKIGVEIGKTFDAFLKVEERGLNRLTGLLDNYQSSLDKLGQTRRDVVQDAAAAQFERMFQAGEKAGDPNYLIDISNRRIAQLQGQMKEAANLGDVERLRDAFGEINNVLDQMRGTGSIGVSESAYGQNLQSFLQLSQVAEGRLNTLADTTADWRNKLQGTKNELASVLKQIEEFDKNAFDKDGNLISGDPARARAELANLQKRAAELQRETLQVPVDGLDPSKRFQTAAQQQADLARRLKREGFDPAAQQKQFQEQQSNLSLRLNALQRDQALEKSRQNQLELEKEIQTAIKATSTTLVDATNGAKTQALEIQKLIESIKGGAGTGTANTLYSMIPFGPFAARTAQEQEARMTAAAASGLVGQAQENTSIAALVEQADRLKAAFAGMEDRQIVNPDDVNTTISVSEALGRLENRIKSLSEAQSGLAAAREQVESSRAAYDEMTQAIDRAVGGVNALNGGQAQLAASAGGLAQLPEMYYSIAEAARAAATAIAAAVAAASGAGIGGLAGSLGTAVAYRSMGGAVDTTMSQLGWLGDFFSGKFGRGTDLIPTMLTRKEMVIRAPMAERYNTELQAINAGRFEPAKRETVVNNTTVGDIHVTIPRDSASDPHAVFQVIRRGIKQGTLRI